MKKYLLENHPILWNTRLVWMLPLLILSHLFFFALGFLMLTDDVIDNYYYSLGEYFEGIPMLFSFIIIVLLLVSWLIYLFRNNAFEHFYPIRSWKLFGEFAVYFVIIFGIISNSISFYAGEKTKVHLQYTDSYIEKVLQQYPERLDYDQREALTEAQRKEYNIAINAESIKEKSFIATEDDEIATIIVIGFALSILLFAVRITSLRMVLLSIVFSGVLSLLLGLFAFIIATNFSQTPAIRIMLLTLWAVFFSLFSSSIYLSNKLFRGIAMNTTLFAFPIIFAITFLYFILEHKLLFFTKDWYNEPLLQIKFLVFWITTIFISSVFTAFYTKVIKRWKAMLS